MTYTPEQQAAISARGRIIVSASAGSGKTFVMINRLVELILEGADLNRVLALTFTNKAAAQMRDRLRSALLKNIGENPAVRARLKEQLKTLPLAEIGTIHAFCGRLIRTHFYLVGADPAFRIISPDDAEGNALSSKAIAEVFEDAYTNGGAAFSDLLAVYFRKKKDTRLKNLVLSLYRAVRGTEGYRETLMRIGQEDMFEEGCEILADDFRKDAAFLFDKVQEVSASLGGKNPRAQTVCNDIAGVCERLLDADGLFGIVAQAKEPFAISTMPRMTKAEGAELKALKTLSACSKAVKELCADIREIGEREEEHARCENGRMRAAALASLALRYDETFSRYKREANALDYDDLEHFALAILENEDARKEISEKYRYVFVDEYQDVNPVQEKLISLVAGEELFLVGDSKQAIYGFRGSKSEYFIQKEKELEHSLRLTSNFRSAGRVLEAVNRVFSPIMENYAPMRGGERYQGYSGEVFFRAVHEEKAERAERSIYSVLENAGKAETDALAEQIALLVEEECGERWYDADEKLEEGEDDNKRYKPVTYGDIAVLTRKNTGDAERIVRALARRGIPVTSSSKTNVCDCFEARLIIDWLSYLDNAEQDIPLATALLSAIGGFTDSELAKIRARFPSPFTFREACREYLKKMADGTAKKLAAFFDVVQILRTHAHVRTAAEVVNELLDLGLERQIAAKQGGRERLVRVRRLAAEAEGSGSVHDFLSRLKATDYRVEYAESGGDGAVKVLTMHASKGLEYPVVILASLDGNFHGAEKDELMFTERLLVSPRAYDTERKLVSDTLMRRAAAVLQRKEELVQEKNLLYVAMTRARCRLHIMYGEREHALSPEYAKRFSDLIDFSACAEYRVEDFTAAQSAPARNAFAAEAAEDSYEELKRAYTFAYPFEECILLPVKSSATDLLRAEKTPFFDTDEEGGHTVEEGLAYHAFLERARFGVPVSEQLAQMRAKGELPEETLALLKAEKLERILAMPALASLNGLRIWREQTFLVRLPACEVFDTNAKDEIVFQGAIDLLCETPQGYLILDYKYSGHGDEYLRARYEKQIRLYKKAAAHALKIDEEKISAKLINIARCREINI